MFPDRTRTASQKLDVDEELRPDNSAGTGEAADCSFKCHKPVHCRFVQFLEEMIKIAPKGVRQPLRFSSAGVLGCTRKAVAPQEARL